MIDYEVVYKKDTEERLTPFNRTFPILMAHKDGSIWHWLKVEDRLVGVVIKESAGSHPVGFSMPINDPEAFFKSFSVIKGKVTMWNRREENEKENA